MLAELGYVGRRVQEDVTARMPEEEERELLRTAADEPVLRLERGVLDGDERTIQADMITMPACLPARPAASSARTHHGMTVLRAEQDVVDQRSLFRGRLRTADVIRLEGYSRNRGILNRVPLFISLVEGKAARGFAHQRLWVVC